MQVEKDKLSEKKQSLEVLQELLINALTKARKSYEDKKSKSRVLEKIFRGTKGINSQKIIQDEIKNCSSPLDTIRIVKVELAKAMKFRRGLFRGDTAMRKGSFNRYLVLEVARVAALFGSNEAACLLQDSSVEFGDSIENTVNRYSEKQFKMLADRLHKIFSGFETAASVEPEDRYSAGPSKSAGG